MSSIVSRSPTRHYSDRIVMRILHVYKMSRPPRSDPDDVLHDIYGGIRLSFLWLLDNLGEIYQSFQGDNPHEHSFITNYFITRDIFILVTHTIQKEKSEFK